MNGSTLHRERKSDARTRAHSKSFRETWQALFDLHEVLWECDASSHRFHSPGRAEKKSGGRIQTAALKISILPEQECYEDLYLTEQPYGFVSGVATDLPDNDCSSAAFT